MGQAASMRSVWFAVCLTVLSVGLSLSSTALCQDNRARARTLFGEGVAAYEEGRFREALSAFEQAYRLAPHPTVRVNMANCFEQLGQHVEALFNYRRFLEETEDAPDTDQHDEVELAVARLTPKVGNLVLEVTPSTANITIDGRSPKRAPGGGGYPMVAGVHSLRVTAQGYEPIERAVDVKGGVDTPIALTLTREAVVEPLAHVPEVVGPTAEPDPESAMSASARLDDSSFEPPPARSRVLLWSAVGATAAFAGGFAVSGSLALKAQRDFDNAVIISNDTTRDDATREAARQDGVEAADRADLTALLSDVFLAGTVVAGGATLWIWLKDRKASREPSPQAAGIRAGPTVMRSGGAGFTFGGRF
jgi:tetratricopeptide (TPR) repeat protein